MNELPAAGFVRFFRCGCEFGEEYHYCKEAESYYAASYFAAMDYADYLDEYYEYIDEERGYGIGSVIAKCQVNDIYMSLHYSRQIEAGAYKDVPESEFYAEPPDDGYDEDPKVVGYP